ncbi:unnamed protein product [Caenorhabditis bovis]|uniref:Hypoxia up-regulated protein 1 n=1 Tax=Caenorhabditis bovis TaxID=2654633 RepID=A0A8S1ETV6_9PELO|nr:unnamed protein product [Caenorhabditis bovis]
MRILAPFIGLLLCLNFQFADAALAAMTVDLGTQFIKIGIVKPGIPMDIVLNPESRRKTPNVVLIRDGQRTFGDAAISFQGRFPQFVVGNLNDLVAKSTNHPSYELFAKRNPFYDYEDSKKNSSSVDFKFGKDSYNVETLLAMILADAKKFTEEYAQIPQILDVVISVPVYFTPVERLAVTRAAEMAGLTVLQLINDGTAAALSHGIFRRKEITEKPQRLMVYDMGAAKTTATLVEFKMVKEKYEKQPKMTVLGVGYDRTLGGQEMTYRLREHLIDLFEKKHKLKKAVRSDKRAIAKFAKEADRLKQVLSANTEHYASISLEDIDERLRVTRDEFNALIKDLEPRIGEPIEQALRMAQIPIEEVDQFVLMGAGTRVPKVQEVIQKVLGSKEIGKFLNTDEAIAMGALFQAAHLSKGFKVKPFNVEEKLLFPVEVHFVSKTKDEQTGEISQKSIQKTLFAANSIYPTNTKTVSLTSYEEDFSISLKYGTIEQLTKKQIQEIGSLLDDFVNINVNGLTSALANRSVEETEFKGVKISFQLDASGIVRIKKAEAVIEKKAGIVGSIASSISGLFSSKTEEGDPNETAPEETENENAEKEREKPKEPVKEEAKEEAKESPEKQEAKNTTETEGTKDEKTVNGTEAAQNVTENPVKKDQPSIIRLQIDAKFPTGYVPNQYDISEGKAILKAFAESEKLAAERAAIANELEAFNFEASQMLEDSEFVEYASEDEKKKLAEETTRIRAWLEDDVTNDTPTSEFRDNLLVIKNIVRSVKNRMETSKNLPAKINTLETLMNTSMTLATMGEDKEESKALFEKEDRDAFKKKLEKLGVWIEAKKAHIETKMKFDDFDVSIKDVEVKINSLNREVDRFMKKMKKVTTLDDLAKNGKVDIDEVAADAEKSKAAEEEASKKSEESKKEEKNGEAETGDSDKKADEEPKTEL